MVSLRAFNTIIRTTNRLYEAIDKVTEDTQWRSSPVNKPSCMVPTVLDKNRPTLKTSVACITYACVTLFLCFTPNRNEYLKSV